MTQDEAYGWMVETPERWLAVGERLVAAASLVWRIKLDPLMRNQAKLTDYIVNDAMAYRHGFYVTAGFGLENFFKGLLVARMLVAGKAVCEQGKTKVQIAGSLKTHRLSKLAKDLSLPLTRSEDRLVTKLETCIRWAGRYPAPTEPSSQQPGIRDLCGTEHDDVLAVAEKCWQAWDIEKEGVYRLRHAPYPLDYDPWVSGRRRR